MGGFRPRRNRRAAACVVTLIALGSGAFATSAQANLAWFGVNTAQAIRTNAVSPGIFYDRLTGMGGNVVREDIDWSQVEPQKGYWQWANPDREINSAPAGVGVILTLFNSPSWARDGFENLAACRLEGPVTCRMPPAWTKLNEWMDFVRTAVSRYRGKVVAVEIWNEPNLKIFWQPRADEPGRWATLVRAASEAAAQVDPSIPVITGGLWNGTDARQGVMERSYLDAAYAALPSLPQYVDGIGIHPYPGQVAPDATVNAFTKTLSDIRAVRDSRDPGKPLWATETGYHTRGYQAITEAQQRDWLLQVYDRLDAAPDVQAMIVHLFESTWLCGLLFCDQQETSYGMVKPAGNVAKPAWTGFHQRFFP